MMHSNEWENQLAKPTSVTRVSKDSESLVHYTTRTGDAVAVRVTPLDQTPEFAEAATLWPDLPQRAQREILDQNIVIAEVVRLTKGDFGPYYAVHAIDAEGGEFTFLSSGQVVNGWIERLSGISLDTGKRIVEPNGKVIDGALPVLCQITEVEGGEFGRYFNLVPPVKQVTASQTR